MRRRIPKKYGEYKTLHCPFCSRIATQKNAQGLVVCGQHLQQVLEEIKCACGSWLEFRSGKFGPYFHCGKCGNVNYHKGLEMRVPGQPTAALQDRKMRVEKPREKAAGKREITITTHDVEYFS